MKYFISIREIKSPLKCKDSINAKTKLNVKPRNNLGIDLGVHIFTFEQVLVVTKIKNLTVVEV